MPNELIGNFSNGAGLVGNLGNAGSGTNNYNDLVNKPSINGVTLAGNKTLSDLGINMPTKVSQLQNDSHYVQQSAIPTKTSQLQNDSGFAYTANFATVAFTGSYNNLSDKPTIPAAQVNSDWNSNSGVSQILNKPNLAAVATSGSYDDLTDKPTIPAAQVNSDWNSNSGVSQILNKPTLAAVATSGSYNDLLNKPTGDSIDIDSDDNTSIKDYIDTRNDYFINEKAVGVWIDNKIIYRCVFTGFNISTTANTWIETTVNASNISTLINGRIIDSSGQSFACSLGYSNYKVAINMPLARSNLTTLVLEYTKT